MAFQPANITHFFEVCPISERKNTFLCDFLLFPCLFRRYFKYFSYF